MILVTVGSQEPFDRLVSTVDGWAAHHSHHVFFAQIGRTDYRPLHLQWSHQLSPVDFRLKAQEATVMVAHAGMGTILTALELGKPILVMPRRAHLRETRNDHQVATAKHLLALGKVHVAFDEIELLERLDTVTELTGTQKISPHASPDLIGALRSFIQGA